MAQTAPAAVPETLGTATAGAGVPQKTTGAQSFRIAGTAIGPGKRQAEIVVSNGTSLDGKVYSVTEGSLVEGYRVVKITRDEVILEVQGRKDGKPFPVPVNNPVATPVPSVRDEAAVASSIPPRQPTETASAAVVQKMSQSRQAAVEPAVPSSRPVPAGVSDLSQLPPEVQTTVRAQAQTFLQELRQNQTFQKKLEEVRPQLLMRAGSMMR